MIILLPTAKTVIQCNSAKTSKIFVEINPQENLKRLNYVESTMFISRFKFSHENIQKFNNYIKTICI